MSLAYQRGYRAALRGLTIVHCPYGGHNDGSLLLQTEWCNGHFDALTQPVPTVRPKTHLTRRRTVRLRWPRNAYARRRLVEILEGKV